jgi:BirA family biotin operon repressor/biotin-[acetyl-CoA-carboxylase] ligase
MKAAILRMLQAADEPVSGEVLRAALGVSRVAVWKHVHKLREHGYRIETSAKGYLLKDAPDLPFSWEFPGREHRVHFHPVVTSTMDVARELARTGCENFTVVVAERQTSGRGRLQRSWQSNAGGLYFTVVLRPALPPMLASRINFCASHTLAQVIRSELGVFAEVKWPNDILVEGGKLAGMLSEMEADSDRILHVNIGIGINVNNTPSKALPEAVSLRGILKRPVSRKALLVAFLDALEARMAEPLTAAVIDEWKQFAVTLNRRVRIVTRSETTEGIAMDVDARGSLLVRLDDGRTKAVLYGDCFHV